MQFAGRAAAGDGVRWRQEAEVGACGCVRWSFLRQINSASPGSSLAAAYPSVAFEDGVALGLTGLLKLEGLRGKTREELTETRLCEDIPGDSGCRVLGGRPRAPRRPHWHCRRADADPSGPVAGRACAAQLRRAWMSPGTVARRAPAIKTGTCSAIKTALIGPRGGGRSDARRGGGGDGWPLASQAALLINSSPLIITFAQPPCGWRQSSPYTPHQEGAGPPATPSQDE